MSLNPPLVLVPGLSGRSHEDFPFVAPMLRRQFEVTEVSFDGIATPELEGLLAIVDSAVAGCATPPVLVGYSLGAVMAARVRHPLASLVLIAGWWRPAPKLVAFANNWMRLREEGSAVLDGVSTLALFSAEGWVAARPLPADALTDALVALAARAGASGVDLPAAAPTLVIGASNDDVATTRESRMLFGAIQDARYTELRGGHAIIHERPAELLELIASFAAAPDRFPAGSIIDEQLP
jgi:pimeloyl-ACP methyl ester carboxylesterase